MASYCITLFLCAFSATLTWATDGHGVELTKVQRDSLCLSLSCLDDAYDPSEHMVRGKAADIGYHTKFHGGEPVHPTRDSLEYVVALLDSGEEDRLHCAQGILNRIIALQDKNPESKTYGIWPWYLEEPLGKMSPPDWNWADFCGVQLLAVWIDHRHRLNEGIVTPLREAILHAARSIERRNVSMEYTNIAVMGTYVMLVAAEQLQDETLSKYARDRLRRLHKAITWKGSFSEYNSPTYSITTMTELTRMLVHVKNEQDRALIRELHDLIWKHIATHFHVPTNQWAGPHSRCYATDIRKTNNYLAVIEVATQGKADVCPDDPLPLGMKYYRLSYQCPDEYVNLFTELPEARHTIETFIKAAPTAGGWKNPVIGTTYLHPRYSLGTVNRGNFWRQQRSILAYWGTQKAPTYLHVRVLHDGYDFCSAQAFTVQHAGNALAAVVFATDGGDTHPVLDRIKHGRIRAKDLRIRFELGGYLKELAVNGPCPEGLVTEIQDRGLRITIRSLGGQLGKDCFRWEAGRDDQNIWFDAIAYSGIEKEIDFNQIGQAFLAFSLCIEEHNGYPDESASASLNRINGILRMSWPMKMGSLNMQLSSVSSTKHVLSDSYASGISTTHSKPDDLH